MTPLEREALPGPSPTQDFDALLAAPDPRREGHPEGIEVGLLVTDADSKDQAASRGDVDDRRVLGHVHGVIQWEEEDTRSHSDPLRGGAHEAREHQRVRKVAVRLLVMLTEETAIESGPLGRPCFDDHFLPQPIDVLRVRRILLAGEVAHLYHPRRS